MQPEIEKRLGEILARLVPGGDFTIYANKNNLIEWRDARPKPSDEEIEQEYDNMIAEELVKANDVTEKNNALDTFISTDISQLAIDDEVKNLLICLQNILSKN